MVILDCVGKDGGKSDERGIAAIVVTVTTATNATTGTPAATATVRDSTAFRIIILCII